MGKFEAVTRLQQVGVVSAIHRYPVKSMQGEHLSEVALTKGGLPGDRAWALRDLELGEITSAKHFPRILQFGTARGPDGDVELVFPNGERCAASAPDISQRISAVLKHRVELVESRGQPRRHYRLSAFRTPRALRRLLGARRGGIMPDLSQLPLPLLATLSLYATPPGTYFDAFPLHLVSTNSIAALSALSGVPADARRFRPNFVIAGEHPEACLLENAWVGRRLLLGAAEVEVCSLTFRCGMPSQPQTGDLAKAPSIVKTIYDRLDSKFGVYARVLRAGRVRVGDCAFIDPSLASTPLRELRDLGRAFKRAVLEAYLSF